MLVISDKVILHPDMIKCSRLHHPTNINTLHFVTQFIAQKRDWENSMQSLFFNELYISILTK